MNCQNTIEDKRPYTAASPAMWKICLQKGKSSGYQTQPIALHMAVALTKSCRKQWDSKQRTSVKSKLCSKSNSKQHYRYESKRGLPTESSNTWCSTQDYTYTTVTVHPKFCACLPTLLFCGVELSNTVRLVLVLADIEKLVEPVAGDRYNNV